jgi:hypothetical protein
VDLDFAILIVLILCAGLQYLIFVFVVIIFLLAIHRITVMLTFWIKGINNNLLSAFYLSSAERTALE